MDFYVPRWFLQHAPQYLPFLGFSRFMGLALDVHYNKYLQLLRPFARTTE